MQTSVNPKVIDCPDPAKGRDTIDAVAKDGIQLKAKARVTVRTNLERLVGGATEETIIARVGEGIVTAIGSAETYKNVLENPDTISKTRAGEGPRRRAPPSRSSPSTSPTWTSATTSAPSSRPTRPRPTSASPRPRPSSAAPWPSPASRRCRPWWPENRAKVVLAEAEIPMAIAEAFREGNLGIMDYYR